eukprot:COSAG04_NODE_32475_length_249_cov_2611.152318_1_plen_44_part_01
MVYLFFSATTTHCSTGDSSSPTCTWPCCVLPPAAAGGGAGAGAG